MAQKPNRTIKPMPVQRPLTEQEKQARIMQFLTQKRETFSLSILSGMVQGAVTNKDVTNVQCKCLVALAVEMADALMEKLYPMPKEETPAEKERERLKGNLKEEVCASDVCAYRGKNVCTIKRDEYCPMFKAKEEGEK